MASDLGRVVINCSNILSCDSKRHFLGDSIDEDSDDDDVGVDQGIPLPTACKSKVVIADPAVGPHPTPSTSAVPTVDKFYNASGKARHPNAIVPKRESGW